MNNEKFLNIRICKGKENGERERFLDFFLFQKTGKREKTARNDQKKLSKETKPVTI